ncbi:MAG: mechanosensitive ion channel family protein [Phycisphaerales bacterium]|nr:mechanosensitive ion channel family protein [Phycisphaerales bacterium]
MKLISSAGLSRQSVLALVTACIWALMVPQATAQDTITLPSSAQDSEQSTEIATQVPISNPLHASPQATMFAFLKGIKGFTDGASSSEKKAGMTQAIECLDVDSTLPFETRWNLAADLYSVLGRIGLVREDQLPTQLADTRFVYYPQTDRIWEHLTFATKHPGYSISLTRQSNGQWLFDRETLDRIHDFAIQTEDEDTIAGDQLDKTLMGRIRDAVPSSLKGNASLGLEYWQWIGILVVIFIGMIADLLVRGILRRLWHRFEVRRGREVEKGSLKRAVRPFGMLAAAGIWYIALELGLLPATPTIVLIVAVRVVLMVSLVWAAFKLTDLIGDWLSTQAEKTETKFDDLLVPMVKRTAKLFIGAIGLVYIASAFRIEIMPLLTGLGIGGLAVAFAAKDTIENFFGSIAVILDRPFEIGDWIYVNEVEGTVEDLGFRSTRIRTFYNSLVTVPNATLVRAKVDNYGRRKYRRFTTKLNVTYDTHPDKIEAFCAGIREIVKLHPYTRKDYYHVWLNGFGPHSLDVLVYIFFECPDWSIELREKHRFMLDVVRLADRLGVEFAFPTQKIHVTQDDPSATHSPMDVPESNSERRWILEGRKAARELTSEQPWKTELPGPVSFAEDFESEHEARGDSAG